MRDGLVVVDKPAGFTSHDVVAKLRKVYGQRRVGHAGTLDPDATGVLLVGLGRATRLLRYLSESGKAYRGRVVFGIATSTLDAAGEVVDQRPMPITARRDRARAAGFVGDIEQLPPMVSAVKVGGRRLHELARAGEEVERAPRPVHVDRFDARVVRTRRRTRRRRSWSSAAAAPTCARWPPTSAPRSAGARTSRSCGGCASARSRSTEARPLADIEAAPDAAVLPLAVAMRDLERVDVDDEQARAVSARGGVRLPACSTVRGDGPYAVVGPDGALLAVYDARGAALRPAVVVAGS